jgi:hypothetical protein
MLFKHAFSRVTTAMIMRGRRRVLVLAGMSGLLALAGAIVGTAGPAFASVSEISLSASPTTTASGQFVTLTATTNAPIASNSGDVIEIYDVTTGLFMTSCGSGVTTCTWGAELAGPTTEEFAAYVGTLDSSPPPPSEVAASAISYVTWTNTGYQLSLSTSISDGGPVTVTATANVDVGPTPDYIDIFNETTGLLVTQCSGLPPAPDNTCSDLFSVGPAGANLVAFLAPDIDGDAAPATLSQLPLPSIQASSNVVSLSDLLVGI